jgi:hypothetical protein
MLDTSSVIKRLFAAEKLQAAIHDELEATMKANAPFKEGDLVKQAAGQYSREAGPGRVIRVIMKRDRGWNGKPDTFNVEGICRKLKKDGTVSMVGEFRVNEKNLVMIEAAKED